MISLVAWAELAQPNMKPGAAECVGWAELAKPNIRRQCWASFVSPTYADSSMKSTP